MHRFPAEPLHKPLGVFFRSETEDLVPFLFPSDRVSESRECQSLLPAEVLDFFVIGARALLLYQAHPVRETSLIRSFETRLQVARRIRSNANALGLVMQMSVVSRRDIEHHFEAFSEVGHVGKAPTIGDFMIVRCLCNGSSRAIRQRSSRRVRIRRVIEVLRSASKEFA